MTAPRTKVAMISPHDVVEAGFSAMLGRHHSRIELVRQRTAAGPGEPDVVLYDVVGLMDGDHTEFDRLIKQTTSLVFAIGRDQRPDLLNQALAQGADGCFLMSICETELLATLEAAMTRKQLAGTSPGPIICACPSSRRPPWLGFNVGLTAREAEVLTLVARGLSNEEIADRDFVSVNTVKTHLRIAYSKIGVHTRSQAVLWVLNHGFDSRAEN